MTYISHVPSPPLNTYIDDFYYVEGPAPFTRLKALPMPSMHLMVNFGGAFQVYEADQAELFATCTQSWSMGLWSKCYIVEWPRNVRFYGVHFKPAGAYPFLRLPLSELHNQVVSLDAIWGHYANEVRERLYAAPTVQAGFALLERLLLARLCSAPPALDVVQYAIREIMYHHGSLMVRSLSDEIGISQNHLATHFKRIVGITPKELARVYRFAHVLHSIDPTQEVDWTFLAHQSRYYDQSHFSKDFTAFTGHSPSDYLRLRRLRADMPGQNDDIGHMPTD